MPRNRGCCRYAQSYFWDNEAPRTPSWNVEMPEHHWVIRTQPNMTDLCAGYSDGLYVGRGRVRAPRAPICTQDRAWLLSMARLGSACLHGRVLQVPEPPPVAHWGGRPGRGPSTGHTPVPGPGSLPSRAKAHTHTHTHTHLPPHPPPPSSHMHTHTYTHTCHALKVLCMCVSSPRAWLGARPVRALSPWATARRWQTNSSPPAS